MSENIDKFDVLVARVFETLYSEFPKKIVLQPTELLDCDEQPYYNEAGYFVSPLADDESDFLYYTVSWLYESGYLLGSINGVWDSKVTLSLKGLQLLKSVPNSVESNSSLGEQLKEAIGNGAKEHAATLIKEALNMNNVMNLISGVFNQT
ncbi:hypothetical protein AAFX33_15265 [Vibrio chagasii]|uniref:hypothetical protein n=1 Tax=Vibrio chagasii TaxID=170679 RepID=UPI0038CDA97F